MNDFEKRAEIAYPLWLKCFSTDYEPLTVEELKTVDAFVIECIHIAMEEKMQDIVNKICGALPEGFEISLCMENGAAWVTLCNPVGELVDLPDAADTTIVQQLNAALCVTNGFIA